MDPVITYDELIHRLTCAFQSWRYDSNPPNPVRMIGIVFARPGAPLAKAEIVPQIPDWHFRSGDHIDFFFAGYTYPHEAIPGYVPVPMPGHQDWLYNPQLFEQFRREIQERTTDWQSSGACDLLLTNARYDKANQKAWIDFSSTVVCQLETLKEKKAIAGIERFFEDIFRFAESAPPDDPTWGFSDRQGISTTGSALKRVVLSLLPKEIGSDIERVAQFAVKDVSKAA